MPSRPSSPAASLHPQKSVDLDLGAAHCPGGKRAFLPEIRVAQIIFRDIPALGVGYEAASATVQLALFLRIGSACRTCEIQRIVTIRHSNFLSWPQVPRMVNFAHLPTKVPPTDDASQPTPSSELRASNSRL